MFADHPHADPGDGRTECQPCGKWVWPVIHSCKGVPVTDQAKARAALAGRYFAEHIEPDDRRDGFPDNMIDAARARYIRDATANPEAMRQIRAMYGDDRRTS